MNFVKYPLEQIPLNDWDQSSHGWLTKIKGKSYAAFFENKKLTLKQLDPAPFYYYIESNVPFWQIGSIEIAGNSGVLALKYNRSWILGIIWKQHAGILGSDIRFIDQDFELVPFKKIIANIKIPKLLENQYEEIIPEIKDQSSHQKIQIKEKFGSFEKYTHFGLTIEKSYKHYILRTSNKEHREIIAIWKN